MGISDLTSLIKEHCDPIVRDVPLMKFKGKRIAVDTMNILIINYSAAKANVIRDRRDEHIEGLSEESLKCIKTKWMDLMKTFLSRFIDNGILPIMVLDGKKNEAKKETLEKRAMSREKDKAKIKEILDKGEDADIEDMKRLASLRTREGTIPKDWIDEMILFFRSLGIPVVTAKGDGEILCCALVVDGEADAVYSTDTDTLACGSPCVITRIVSKRFMVFDPKKGKISAKRGYVCECYKLRDIVMDMGLTMLKFKWLCVMLGNDFNHRVKGIGPKKSYCRVKDAKEWIDVVEGLDSECLNYDLCMGLFGVGGNWRSIIDGDYSLEKGEIDGDTIGTLGQSVWLSDVVEALDKLK